MSGSWVEQLRAFTVSIAGERPSIRHLNFLFVSLFYRLNTNTCLCHSALHEKRVVSQSEL